LVHKTEVGGVITDVRNEEELAKHYALLMERAKSHGLKDAHVVVQSMVRGGVEMVLGMVRDPKFGPMVMCGLGGVFVEVVRDIAFKLPPIAAPEALEMVQGLKGQKLLTGYRGAPPVDTTPMVDAVVTLSHLVTDFPNLRELDINPFILCPDPSKSRAIDARLILEG